MLGDGLVDEGHRARARRAGRWRSPSAGWRSSIIYRIVGRQRPGPGRRAGSGSARSSPASLLALSHGTNDAQKTMGIIFLALVANGNAQRERRRPDLGRRLRRPPRSRSAPTSAAGASSAPWAAGSSRWTRRRASRAQGVGATVILAASHAGFPLSTTQVISGAIMGTGAAKRVSAVRWGVAGNIVVAWVLTLPALGRGRRAHLRGRGAARHRRAGPDRRLRRAARGAARRAAARRLVGGQDADGGGLDDRPGA